MIFVVSFIFVSIFHVIGGAMLGTGLRRLRNGVDAQAIALIVFGALVGGGPLFRASSLFGEINQFYFTSAQVVVFVGVILLALFLPEATVQLFQSVPMRNIGLGGVLIFSGVMGSIGIFEQSPSGAIAMLAFFSVTGIVLVAVGLRALFKS